jgi:hypothetical protein
MINGKFGSLAAKVDEQPYRVVLTDPQTGAPLKDTDGAEAFIDVLSAQSAVGRKFDREQRTASMRKAMRAGRNQSDVEDELQINFAKLARLTVAWHLVDPNSKAALDVEVSVENAAEFYSLPLAWSFYLQAWLAAIEPANFLPSASNVSLPSPRSSSATPAD